MTLEEMGREYLIQSGRLAARMQELRAARAAVPFERQLELEARIALLYREVLETRRIGRMLCGYYGREAPDASQALYA